MNLFGPSSSLKSPMIRHAFNPGAVYNPMTVNTGKKNYLPDEFNARRLVIADDNPVITRLVRATIQGSPWELQICRDGLEAFSALDRVVVPTLAIVNWIMPGLDGVEVVRRVRTDPLTAPLYIILLTAKGRQEDIVEGLRAGADDYVIKPFIHEELRARIRVGERVIDLEKKSRERLMDLERVLSNVSQLQGMLPICSYCKKIRDDHNYWEQVESYMTKHSDVRFSHSVCPDCDALYVRRPFRRS
ncbi:MAG: response regulator [Blastocatellia bacterium AA13]|nr:MAG: response regulator [Blastocatellia bacterium AA13]